MAGYAPPYATAGAVDTRPAWKSGLFDCFTDLGSCCNATCCPCLLYGDIVEGLGKGGDKYGACLVYCAVCSLLPGCQCILGMNARQDIRTKYGLPEAPCADVGVHCCCHLCALCQEYRQLTYFGAIKNLVGLTQLTAPPPVPGQMYTHPGHPGPISSHATPYAAPSQLVLSPGYPSAGVPYPQHSGAVPAHNGFQPHASDRPSAQFEGSHFAVTQSNASGQFNGSQAALQQPSAGTTMGSDGRIAHSQHLMHPGVVIPNPGSAGQLHSQIGSMPHQARPPTADPALSSHPVGVTSTFDSSNAALPSNANPSSQQPPWQQQPAPVHASQGPSTSAAALGPGAPAAPPQSTTGLPHPTGHDRPSHGSSTMEYPQGAQGAEGRDPALPWPHSQHGSAFDTTGNPASTAGAPTEHVGPPAGGHTGADLDGAVSICSSSAQFTDTSAHASAPASADASLHGPLQVAHSSANSSVGTVVIPQGVEIYNADLDNTSEVEEKRRALEEAKADPDYIDVHVVLDYLQEECGGEVDGKYVVDPDAERLQGGQAIVVFCETKFGGRFAMKLFSSHATFLVEADAYKLLMSCEADGTFIREMRDHAGDALPGAGGRMPSYIVMKRGMSMQDWIRKRKPAPLMGIWMLGEICTQVGVLHSQGLVHRDLKPGNVLWLQDDSAWRVIDLGCVAREGTNAAPAFTLRFSPPEVVAAAAASAAAGAGAARSLPVHRSADVWAVGVMAFEMISGELLYPASASSDEIKAILAGTAQFPHEADPRVWLKMGRLKRAVQRMLSRDPAARPSIASVSRKLDAMAMATGATTTCYRSRSLVARGGDARS